MGTGRSNLVDSSFNVLDVRHLRDSSLGSYLQITSGPFRFMIPIHWVWDKALIYSDIALLTLLNVVYVSIGHRPSLLNLVSSAGPRPWQCSFLFIGHRPGHRPASSKPGFTRGLRPWYIWIVFSWIGHRPGHRPASSKPGFTSRPSAFHIIDYIFWNDNDIVCLNSLLFVRGPVK